MKLPGTPEMHQFILVHGYRSFNYEMSAVLGITEAEVDIIKRTGACTRLDARKDFGQLFILWNGRAPDEAEWPLPRKWGKNGVEAYEWQTPELELLASLTGQAGLSEIAQILTARLRKITGDPEAVRTRNGVQNHLGEIGMQVSDVLGGITASDAGKEIGSLAIINHNIRENKIKTRRVGRLVVIDHDEWERWKAQRVFPPKDYIQLARLKEPLAIKSDKLSEYARMGYVDTAILCDPYGTNFYTSKFGTWFIHKKVAKKLMADRRAGRPMPWHGKPLLDNLRVTFRLWESRKHPEYCDVCRDIWGDAGTPVEFDDYIKRYPPLDHGAKRHLTKPWSPGMTIDAVAEYTKQSEEYVRTSINNGMLEVRLIDGVEYITRTDATRWLARRCPDGEHAKSWISIETAIKHYLFTQDELMALIESKQLPSKIGDAGAMKGILYVSRHQCGHLRERFGFTEVEAANRVGVSVARLKQLLDGVEWRTASGIPLQAVQTAAKRMESKNGYSVEDAATKLIEEGYKVNPQWVRERINDGTIKVIQVKWEKRRIYITEPMMGRLRNYIDHPSEIVEVFGPEWLLQSHAAQEAGVTGSTVIKWAVSGEVTRRDSKNGWRYHREALRARARKYWGGESRFLRKKIPEWLTLEREQAAAAEYSQREAA